MRERDNLMSRSGIDRDDTPLLKILPDTVRSRAVKELIELGYEDGDLARRVAPDPSKKSGRPSSSPCSNLRDGASEGILTTIPATAFRSYWLCLPGRAGTRRRETWPPKDL